MNTERLKFLIAEGEGLTVEFKERYSSKIDRDIVAMADLFHRTHKVERVGSGIGRMRDLMRLSNLNGHRK